ncbi:restriction endonuclease subunit S [Shewanella sp. 10N.286.45.A1]|uniref:restriction endonuclease subunit S n=1 Tax=Shewanella sp. 10N.286.45.A1 TaxID=3229694 RepID=UPI00354F0B49
MSSLQVIPDGYKQTEVGVIPEDWDVSPLNEVCGFGGGTTPPRAQHDRYFVNGSNNWVKTTDLNNSLIDVSEEQITDLALSETGLKKHPVGSVLVAMYGGFNQIGRTGYITKPSAINQALVAVKPKPKKINSYYLLSELNYNVDYWKGVASSSRKDPNITSNDVKNYVIALPSIEEQTAIANALSDVDALLSELEKLIAKKQAIKTATMQQLLTGKTRLPEFVKYENGESSNHIEENNLPNQVGSAPDGWGLVTLGQDATLKARIGWQALTTKEYLEFGPRFLVTGTDFNAGLVDWNSCCYVSEWRYKQDSNIQLREGDVLVTKDGTIGKVGYVSKLPLEATLNSGVFVIRPKNKKFVPKFLFYVLNSSIFTDFIRAITAGSTITHLYQRDFVNFGFYAPAEEEQNAIATILSDMDEDIQALNQRLSKIRQIKQGMMQELLTGKTRLIQGEAHD